MNNRLLIYIDKWSTDEDTFEYTQLGLQIDHLERNLYFDYEPSVGPKLNFSQRLEKWIDNVADDDSKKTLLRFIPEIFYIGRKEMESLYRDAFNTIITRWLIDNAKIQIDLSFEENVKTAISETWFCPITDSMRINQFFHVNDIKNSSDLRPEWKSLSFFGSIEKIKKYLETHRLKYIVLLEDFVGSGNQIKDTLDFAAQNFPENKILVVPLVMCPEANKQFCPILKKYTNLEVIPVLTLDESTLIPEDYSTISKNIFQKIYEIARREHERMEKGGLKYSFLGFRKIGATVVLYTNTPNNSLPIIWSENNWEPLFKRHIRI